MSLNGLDDPKVKEAHDASVAEPGGWYDDPLPSLSSLSSRLPHHHRQNHKLKSPFVCWGTLRLGASRNVLRADGASTRG